MKSKKVSFVLQDHWNDVIHYVERKLDVSMEVTPRGILFTADEEEADSVLEEITTNSNLSERLNLKHSLEQNLDVDVSLVSVLIASNSSIKKVELV